MYQLGFNALNTICDALGLPEDVTGIDLSIAVDDVPRLTVYRLVRKDDVERLTQVITESFTLAATDDRDNTASED